ncbi:MAG: lysophospholipid acyltransferase family protein [Proteobacteria bacterium]|nr:lysophospholipid acyltransferase family protein [Pseudomonadota bacterium]
MKRTGVEVPQIARPLLNAFLRYIDFYMGRRFHAVRLAKSGRPAPPPEMPLLVCLNHPSWWDPLFALLLSRCVFPGRSHYAPMESKALANYGFFRKLGFFGIEPGTVSGAKTFLEMGQAILNHPACALWVTAQGTFVDARQRPVELRSGIGHLLHRTGRCMVLPLALEYAFWNESTPEALARFGDPVMVENGADSPAAEWTARIAAALERAQDQLARDAAARDPKAFDNLLAGGAGVGGVYDLWRRAKARLRGREFQAAHGGDF